MSPRTFFLLTVSILLVGCSGVSISRKATETASPAATLTPRVMTATSVATVTLPLALSTLTPSPFPTRTFTVSKTPIPTPTITRMQTATPIIFQDQCLEVASSLPQDFQSDGVIVLFDFFRDAPIYLWNMKTGNKNLLPQKSGEIIEGLEISPDGKWLAYWSHRNKPGDISLSDSWLMVVAVDGQPFQLIPWEEGWRTVEGGWIMSVC